MVHIQLSGKDNNVALEKTIQNIVASYPEIGELYSPQELAFAGNFWVDDYLGKIVD